VVCGWCVGVGRVLYLSVVPSHQKGIGMKVIPFSTARVCFILSIDWVWANEALLVSVDPAKKWWRAYIRILRTFLFEEVREQPDTRRQVLRLGYKYSILGTPECQGGWDQPLSCCLSTLEHPFLDKNKNIWRKKELDIINQPEKWGILLLPIVFVVHICLEIVCRIPIDGRDKACSIA